MLEQMLKKMGVPERIEEGFGLGLRGVEALEELAAQQRKSNELLAQVNGLLRALAKDAVSSRRRRSREDGRSDDRGTSRGTSAGTRGRR